MSGSGSEETHPTDGDKDCPSCGKKTVIVWDPTVVMTYPPIYHFWRTCGCGWRGETTHWSPKRPPTTKERWEAINDEK